MDPQSPNLNITETVLDHLDREQKKTTGNIQQRALNVLQGAWRAIPAH